MCFFSPCFFKLCPFLPPTGAIPSEKPSTHVSPKAEGLSGPCSHQEGECPRYQTILFHGSFVPLLRLFRPLRARLSGLGFPSSWGNISCQASRVGCLGTVVVSYLCVTCRVEQNHWILPFRWRTHLYKIVWRWRRNSVFFFFFYSKGPLLCFGCTCVMYCVFWDSIKVKASMLMIFSFGGFIPSALSDRQTDKGYFFIYQLGECTNFSFTSG